jgi:release factor glutamine methyltransferase
VSITEAYKRGRVAFMGLDLMVAPGALVPRAETELLAQTALDILADMSVSAPRVIDMCTGAGNLACAIAHHVPAARVWSSDLTDGCVAVARRNAEQLGLADRVAVCQGDLFAGLDGLGLENSIDFIVCNPPYISQKRLEGDRAELLVQEPREAFDGGPYGLTIHQRVIKEGLPYLRAGGMLAFEIGLGQERQVKILFERAKAYEDIRLVETSQGEVRVVLGRKKAG